MDRVGNSSDIISRSEQFHDKIIVVLYMRIKVGRQSGSSPKDYE